MFYHDLYKQNLLMFKYQFYELLFTVLSQRCPQMYSRGTAACCRHESKYGHGKDPMGPHLISLFGAV